MEYATRELYGKDKLPELASMDFVSSCDRRVELLDGMISRELDKRILERDMDIVKARADAIDFWLERIKEVIG